MMNFFQTIGKVVLTGYLAVASIFTGYQAPAQNVGATIPIVVSVFQTSLQASITASATSMTLVTGTDKAGNTLSGYMCFNIDEGTAIEEFVCGTVSGTAVTSMIRGIDPIDGDLEVTALKKAHRRGASVKITNYPSLAVNSRILNGNETLPNPITYASGVGPVGSSDLTDKEYVLSVVNGGTVIFNQEIVSGTAGETVSAGQLLYFDETQNEWMKTDADTLATVFNVQLGIAQGSGTDGNSISGGVLISGEYTTSGLTKGDLVYASNTAGAFTSGTVGTVPRIIGTAKDSTTLLFNPNFQSKLYDYAVDASGTDSYAITLPGGLSTPFVGMELVFKAGTANTGAATLAVNGGSAKTIVKYESTALGNNDILANQIVKVVYNGTNWQLISTPNVSGYFGDGSDGDATISGTTTLTKDMYYNNLTVTGTLNTENWRVFVQGTLAGNGTIQANGGNGGNGGTPTAGSAGAKVPDGYFSTLQGVAGGAGKTSGTSNGNAGTAGTAVSTSIGVVGVAGGNGDGVTGQTGGTGGAAGALTAVLQRFGVIKHQTISAIDYALNGTPTKYNGSTGSGGGGGGAEKNNGNTHTSGGGGGSGAPGGIVALFVNNWTGTMTIKAVGGNGGNGGDGVRTGSDEAGGGGGGSGGSGGHTFVVYRTKTWTGSFVVTGGSGGTKGTGVGSISAGTNGNTGTTGTSTEINIATLL